MMDNNTLMARVSFHGPDWIAIRSWLETERQNRVQKLINSKSWDDSLKHQGAIDQIDRLLRVETDAVKAASRQGQ